MADNTVVEDHINKAEGYLMLGMHEDALHETAAALAIDPASYRAHVLEGVTLISLDRFADAGRALDRAIELNPNEAEGYIHLAYVHRRTVSLEQAVATILKAVELEPQMPLANYNLACYHALKGDTDDALRFLGRAINIAPTFREAARADEDFSGLHTNDRFRRLVEME